MVRCTSFCFVNILKFIMYYFTSAYLYNIAREYFFISPLFMFLGLLFGFMSIFTIYKMCVNKIDVNGSIVFMKDKTFRTDVFDLVSDSNYKIIEKKNKLIIYHFNRTVELKWYYKGFNRLKQYLLYSGINITQSN